MASFGHVARVRLPMVQNTTADSACSEARYCTSASSALKVKTRVMPRSTMVSTVTPRCWLMKWMKRAAAIAMSSALIDTM
jgi:hypothetical protein